MHLAAIGANPDLLVVGKGNIATIGGLQLVDSVLRQSVTQREALIKAHDSVSVSSSIFFR